MSLIAYETHPGYKFSKWVANHGRCSKCEGSANPHCEIDSAQGLPWIEERDGISCSALFEPVQPPDCPPGLSCVSKDQDAPPSRPQ